LARGTDSLGHTNQIWRCARGSIGEGPAGSPRPEKGRGDDGIPPGDRLGKHVDTAEETQYVLSGSGDLLTDDGAQPIKPGDVFILTEGASHDLHNTGSEDLRVVAFFSKPQVEQHWDVEAWPPDDARVTGSPNRG
jgi:hypothetical protein